MVLLAVHSDWLASAGPVAHTKLLHVSHLMSLPERSIAKQPELAESCLQLTGQTYALQFLHDRSTTLPRYSCSLS